MMDPVRRRAIFANMRLRYQSGKRKFQASLPAKVTVAIGGTAVATAGLQWSAKHEGRKLVAKMKQFKGKIGKKGFIRPSAKLKKLSRQFRHDMFREGPFLRTRLGLRTAQLGVFAAPLFGAALVGHTIYKHYKNKHA